MKRPDAPPGVGSGLSCEMPCIRPASPIMRCRWLAMDARCHRRRVDESVAGSREVDSGHCERGSRAVRIDQPGAVALRALGLAVSECAVESRFGRQRRRATLLPPATLEAYFELKHQQVYALAHRSSQSNRYASAPLHDVDSQLDFVSLVRQEPDPARGRARAASPCRAAGPQRAGEDEPAVRYAHPRPVNLALLSVAVFLSLIYRGRTDPFLRQGEIPGRAVRLDPIFRAGDTAGRRGQSHCQGCRRLVRIATGRKLARHRRRPRETRTARRRAQLPLCDWLSSGRRGRLYGRD